MDIRSFLRGSNTLLPSTADATSESSVVKENIHVGIPIWISIWGSPQGKVIFPFSTQFYGYGDPYWDIRIDIHTDIPIPIELS